MAKKKTTDDAAKKCPITRDAFMSQAKPIIVQVGDEKRNAMPKLFSTGSFGYYAQDKIHIEVDGVLLKLQCNISMQVVGSKNAE